jgi:ABC-2 type transport system permease protein
VADVARLPGLWEQIRLVAGLRWRILRNSLRKKNNLLDLIGLISAGFFAGIFVLGISVGVFFGTYYFVSSGQEGRLVWFFWSIFLLWQLAPVFMAGFGAGFEFRTLLRFPLSFRAFYLVGLAYGLADFAGVSALCWLTALTLAAAAANPELLPTLLVIIALFLLMNVTLERLIGSWLERLLARRRARELFFGLFLLLMISFQFIGPAVTRYGDSARPWVGRVLPFLSFFPPSLVARAVVGAATHEFGDTLLGAAGISAYLLLFSALLWLRFAAQYSGEELSETAAPARAKTRRVSSEGPETDALALLSPQVASVLRKEFRYLTRNGFSFFILIVPPLAVLLIISQFAGRHPTVANRPIPTDLFFPGVVGYLVLIIMAPAYNCFAYEGKGIQIYFTAPLRFRDVLLGKNIIQLSIICLEVFLSFVVFSYFVGVPSAPVLAATLVAIVFVVVGQLTIANWSSLSFPRKLEFGQFRGQRQSGMAVLVSFGTQLLLGGICAPILFLGRWTGDRWLPAEVFAFLAAAAIAGYLSSLKAFTQFAEKKKETLIDALCR